MMVGLSDVKREVAGDDLKPYFSRFLFGGIHEDILNLEHVKVDGARVDARCKLDGYFVSPVDGRFHLSAITGTMLTIQVGMVHGLVLNGFEKKTVEVYMSEYNVTFRSQVIKPENVNISMNVLNKVVVPIMGRRAHPRTFYKWSFTLGQDGVTAWSGTMTLAFPFG